MSLLAKQDKRNVAPRSSGLGASSRFKTTLQLRLRSFREAVSNGEVPEGTVWLVRIIEAGKSLNGPIYTPDALRASVAVFEGAPVFNYAWSEDPAAADAQHLPDEIAAVDSRGLTGNQVGSLEGVHFNEQAQALDAYLKVYDPKLRERMLTAFKLGDIGEGGRRDTFGLSIDAQGDTDPGTGRVVRITAANSVDLVSTPAAGGRIRRLVAALQSEETEATEPADLTEEAKATTSAPGEIAEQVQGEQEQSMKITENAATFAGQLKLWADQLSTAPDDEALAMMERIRSEIDKAIAAYEGGETMEDETESAESQEAESVKQSKDETVAAQAAGDDFARMSAGLTEKLREALKSGDASKLREAAIEVVGEEPQQDEKDKQIAALQEKLKGQAIDRAMSKLSEELRLAEGAGPMILKLIDREALTFDSDYREVDGLKEAIKTVVKDFPGFVAAVEAATVEEASAESERQTEAVEEQVAVAAAAPLGQSVPLRESVREGVTREPTRRDLALLKRYESRMMAGDHKAMKKHRDLRAQLGL